MEKKQYKNSKYDIYEDGRCYSHLSHKFLTPSKNKYPTYNLTLPEGKKKVYVHRMVAETFIIPNNPQQIYVNHKDGNTYNFHKDNLEWVTPSENNKHAADNGLRKKGNQTINIFIENLPQEEWTEVKEYPLYLISNHGRIMNRKTKRLLKITISNTGYPEVNLWREGRGKTYQIHRLVYSNFHNDFELFGYVINHKDGNKTNNILSNLEKITFQENNLHAVYIINTNKSSKAVQQISDNIIINQYSSIAQAQRLTGINNISRAIKTGRKAGGYNWKFVENN